MAGFLIAEIGCPCRLVSQAFLPSWFRSLLPLPPCLPSVSPFMISLLAAAAALSPKRVSLHDFALCCRCRLVSQACLPSWFRSWHALSPKLVSLRDFALGCVCRLVSQLVSLRESPDSWKLWGFLLFNGWVPHCGNWAAPKHETNFANFSSKMLSAVYAGVMWRISFSKKCCLWRPTPGLRWAPAARCPPRGSITLRCGPLWPTGSSPSVALAAAVASVTSLMNAVWGAADFEGERFRGRAEASACWTICTCTATRRGWGFHVSVGGWGSTSPWHSERWHLIAGLRPNVYGWSFWFVLFGLDGDVRQTLCCIEHLYRHIPRNNPKCKIHSNTAIALHRAWDKWTQRDVMSHRARHWEVQLLQIARRLRPEGSRWQVVALC